MYTVGKLDMDKYRCISDTITTDEVVITDERIQHIEARHPGDFERISPYLAQAIFDPDYILEDKHSCTSALVLKSVRDGALRFQMILRVHTSDDNPEFRNSILSAWTISASRWKSYIKNRKTLYKRE